MLTPFPDVDTRKKFERSFDFSTLLNLQEVTFGFNIRWTEGGIPWIPMALSTLRPTTSPCLSAIRLDFTGTPTNRRSVEMLIEDAGNDLRRVADEVGRIEREFKGAVIFTVLLHPRFEAISDIIGVRLRPCGADVISWSYRLTFVHSLQILPQYGR